MSEKQERAELGMKNLSLRHIVPIFSSMLESLYLLPNLHPKRLTSWHSAQVTPGGVPLSLEPQISDNCLIVIHLLDCFEFFHVGEITRMLKYKDFTSMEGNAKIFLAEIRRRHIYTLQRL